MQMLYTPIQMFAFIYINMKIFSFFRVVCFYQHCVLLALELIHPNVRYSSYYAVCKKRDKMCSCHFFHVRSTGAKSVKSETVPIFSGLRWSSLTLYSHYYFEKKEKREMSLTKRGKFFKHLRCPKLKVQTLCEPFMLVLLQPGFLADLGTYGSYSVDMIIGVRLGPRAFLPKHTPRPVELCYISHPRLMAAMQKPVKEPAVEQMRFVIALQPNKFQSVWHVCSHMQTNIHGCAVGIQASWVMQVAKVQCIKEYLIMMYEHYMPRHQEANAGQTLLSVCACVCACTLSVWFCYVAGTFLYTSTILWRLITSLPLICSKFVGPFLTVLWIRLHIVGIVFSLLFEGGRLCRWLEDFQLFFSVVVELGYFMQCVCLIKRSFSVIFLRFFREES